MNTLDEFLNEPRAHGLRGCRICGKPVEASLQVFVRKASANGAVPHGPNGKSKSRTWALCGAHGVEIFSRITDNVDAETAS